MLPQEFGSDRRVLHSFREVEPLIKLKSLLPFRFGLVSQLNSRFLAPKKVGTDRHKSVCCIPVTHLPHVLVNAKDFLQHDDARAITTGRQSKVGVELSVIE